MRICTIKKSNCAFGVLCMILLLGACSTDEETNYIKISSLDDILPVTIQADLSKHMPIYKGNTPPNVEGAYNLKPVLTYSTISDDIKDYGVEGVYDNEIITFLNQNNSNRISYLDQLLVDEAEDEDGNEIKVDPPILVTSNACDTAYIFGTLNHFTLCAVSLLSDKDADGIVVTAKIVDVISGSKNSLGIKDLYITTLVLAKNDPSNILRLYGINQYRICKDNDDLANNYSVSMSRGKNEIRGIIRKSRLFR